MIVQPTIKRAEFAAALQAHVDAAGSVRKLVNRHKGFNVAMISRACNGKPICAANMLHLCACLELDIWQFYAVREAIAAPIKPIKTIGDILKNQPVTVRVSREKQEAR